MTTQLDSHGSLPSHALDVLQDDALLPICKACGTQYPGPTPTCPICEDPRQFVPASGQAWTNLAELGPSRTVSIVRDDEDVRISSINVDPPVGINQTPFIIETAGGSYIWDCAATINPALVGYLLGLTQPLKAIAISHPHFFASSLTWARALRVPLYLCKADKRWFQRLGDIRPEDNVQWWSGEAILGQGVKVVQCGGHFPGSCILYWDRLQEPPPAELPTKPVPVSGIIFTADTIMVQPTQTKFTFIWSAPNMIPLDPRAVLKILKVVENLPFAQATSTWPNRFVREDAKKVLQDSVRGHLAACGWAAEGDQLVPLEGSVQEGVLTRAD